MRGTAAAVRRLPRPRLTGRAAILLAVLAVLAISFASSVRAFIEQRHELTHLHGDIARSHAQITSLQRERARWDDPAFKEQMARDKFGFVKQGEIGFIVLDANGQPIDQTSTLSDPAPEKTTTKTQWYDKAWASVQAADHPPVAEETPKPAEELPAP